MFIAIDRAVVFSIEPGLNALQRYWVQTEFPQFLIISHVFINGFVDYVWKGTVFFSVCLNRSGEGVG